MKKLYFTLFIFALISQKIDAQNFAGLYTFANVTTTSGLIDPTPVPTATGLTFGSFSAVGTPANPNAGTRFSFQTWPLGATDAIDTYNTLTGSINTGEYYQVTLTPSVGYSIALSGITFTTQRSGTGIRTYSVRSSLDGYATDLPASINPSNTNLSVQSPDIFFWNFDATTTAQNGSTITLGVPFSNLTAPVTFRFYAWNAELGTGTFSIDNVTFGGTATALTIQAAFTPSANNVCEGTPISFVDNSQSFNGPIANWSWNFGDPTCGPTNTSTIQNPSHTFCGCGTYLVKLFVTNSNNDVDSAQTLITILCNPGAAFSATPLNGCGQICVDFTDLSIGPPVAWSWNYGDLSTDFTQNPNHCYINPGMYTISLTVTAANGCTGMSVMPNYINVYPVPVANFSSSVAGPAVTFTNTSTGGTGPYTYLWNFGDGSPTNNSSSPVHTYVIDGTYTACLTVTDANGCTDTTCHSVIVLTTGIDQGISASPISVYPNPSLNGIFYLDIKENAVLSIYDLVGKAIRNNEKVKAGTNTIDLHELSTGTYFIKIENENSIVTKKISVGK